MIRTLASIALAILTLCLSGLIAAPHLTVSVRLGTGTGPTRLAAFDAALRRAGIADRNLLVLSSIIPPRTRIERHATPATCPGSFGDRLYVVMYCARGCRVVPLARRRIRWR